MRLKFIDLFAGIGGFHHALAEVCEENNVDFECIVAAEIDMNAQRNYKMNFPNTNLVPDVKELNAENLGEYDILLAGFPCQSFSQGGKRLGFEDKTRGTLFFDVARILKETRPKFFVLENVKGLVNHDDKKTLKVILDTISELGYKTTRKNLIVSPKDIGIPQNRERIFILGIRGDLIEEDFVKVPKLVKKDFVFELDKDENNYVYIEQKLKNIINAWGEFVSSTERLPNRTIPVIWVDEMNEKMPADFDDYPNWKKKYLVDMKQYYKLNKAFIDDWIERNDCKSWSIRDKKLEWQAGKDCNEINDTMLQLRQSGLRFSKLDVYPALVAMVQIPILVKHSRYLTVKEAASLQSFRNHNFDQNSNIAFKQLGNSVSIDVVKQLIKSLLFDNGVKI